MKIIEDDVMIGAEAEILKNVNIGKDSKIGASEVVNEDVPDGATVIGVPDRIKENK